MQTLTHQLKEKENRAASKNQISNFYDETTSDYSFWSKDLNMHFGYFSWFKTNPFRRDAMLNEMNEQILTRLNLKSGKGMVVDLGCGMGGTMRYMMKRVKNLATIGVTLSPFQVREGNKLLAESNGLILEEDYCDTSISSCSANGAVAIESLCHSGHSRESLREAFRLLKPGGSFVVGDAFLKKSPSTLCYGSKFGYQQLCKGWSLDGLGVITDVKTQLKQVGFSQVKIEDVSYRVAPSLFHVPFAILGFLVKQLVQQQSVKSQSWSNLKASFFALICGIHLKDFGYYIITAKK